MEDLTSENQLNGLFSDNQLNQMINQNNGEPIRDDSKHLMFTDGLTENKILEKTKKWESQWDKSKSTYEKALKVHYNAYKNQEVTIEGVSVKIPEIFAQIETELPHLLNSIFGQSLIVDATAKFLDPNDDKTNKIKNYVNTLLKDNCNGRRKTEDIIKNMLIYGFSAVKIYWDTEPDKDIDIQSGSIIYIDSAHPNFDLVDPWSFAYDNNNLSHEIKNCEWVRERINISKDKMLVMRDNNLCAYFEDDDMGTAEDKGKKARNKTANEDDEDITYYDEYSATFYDKDETGKANANEYIVWVLSGNKVIKFIPNPQKEKMYLYVRAYQNPSEFPGMGESEILGPLASHLSYVHHQIGILAKKTGQHLTLLTPNAGISSENLRRIENGVIMLENLDQIQFEKTSDAQDIKTLMEMGEYLDGKVQDVSGIGPALAGQQLEGADITALETSMVFANASNRLSLKLTHLQEDFIKELAEKVFLMSKQLLQAPIQFMANNNNLTQLQPEDFLGNYNWNATGSIMQANKAMQMQTNSSLYAQIIQMQNATMNSANPFTTDPVYYFQQYIAPFANISDTSKFIIPLKSLQPPPQAIQQGIAGPPNPSQPNPVQGQTPNQQIQQQAPTVGTPNNQIQAQNIPIRS